MTAETILYCLLAFIGGSICTTIFLCLVFRATGPKDEASEILKGLREPMWKTTETRYAPKDEEASHE